MIRGEFSSHGSSRMHTFPAPHIQWSAASEGQRLVGRRECSCVQLRSEGKARHIVQSGALCGACMEAG
eukprot:5336743-Pyramimonas_sp.AAC.1